MPIDEGAVPFQIQSPDALPGRVQQRLPLLHLLLNPCIGIAIWFIPTCNSRETSRSSPDEMQVFTFCVSMENTMDVAAKCTHPR